ncbi:MAG: acyl-[ACP]--phospholipid O-acyltransferase [bacterium]
MQSENDIRTFPRGFIPFIATQFFGAFNDNAFKLLVVLVAVSMLPSSDANAAARFVSLGSMLLIIPFLVFASFAGWLSDKYSKKKVMVGTKLLEIVIMLIAIVGIYMQNLFVLFSCIFLLGLQSTIFGPAKYGILPEILSPEALSRGNGILAGFTFLAIVLGTAFGGVLKPIFQDNLVVIGFILLSIAVIGFLTSLFIHPAKSSDPYKSLSLNPLSPVIKTIKEHYKNKYLMAPITGLVYFWFLGALIQMTLLLFSQTELQLDDIRIGILLAVMALSAGVGSVLAGRFSERKVEIGLVPLGAMGMSVSLLLFPAVAHSYIHVLCLSALSGMFAGFFALPLNAIVQFESPAAKRGGILASVNFLTFTGILAASFLFPYFTTYFHLKPSIILFVFGCVTLAISTYLCIWLEEFLVRFLLWLLTHTIYKIRIVGRENLPYQGPALLVANHMSFIDALLIGAVIPRFIRFIMHKSLFEIPVLHHFTKILHAIPIAPGKQMKEALDKAASELQKGELVCIFPEGQITRTGGLLEFKRGMEEIARNSNAPIIPIHLDNVWGSLFSYEKKRFFWKMPKKLPYPVTVSFGKPLPSNASSDTVRMHVMDLGAQSFPLRPSLSENLVDGMMWVTRKRWNKKAMSDTLGLELSYGRLLTLCLLLKNKLKKLLNMNEPALPDLKRHAVGIVLPAGIAGAAANISVLLSGYVPINLNFTSSEESIHHAANVCKIKYIITSKKFLGKINIKLPGQLIFIEELFKNISTLEKALAYSILKILPFSLLRLITGTYKMNADDVVTVLFSSGSTGIPKGVMLTHKNIRSNAEGLSQVFDVNRYDCIAGILPLFHSFGFTGTIWFPLLNGFSAAYHPNPLDAKVVGQMVQKEHCTILLATPTFLSLYKKKINPEQFKTLHTIIVGAEKLEADLAKKVEDTYHVKVREGYGATELSPVAALNIADVTLPGINQVGTKIGTIGNPIPGVCARIIRQLENGNDLMPDFENCAPFGEMGMLWISGHGVMKGYCGQPELTDKVIKKGWYKTGDLASIDKAGFITFHGRISRFSKIAGEMVPHQKIEELLRKNAPEGIHLAVTGITDMNQKEHLIVLYTGEFDCENAYSELRKANIPNLWIPAKKNFFRIDMLPVLGTGKLDLKSLQELAKKYFDNAS